MIIKARELFNRVYMMIYVILLTNSSGRKLKKIASSASKKKIRLEYSETFFSKLGIKVRVKNTHNLPKEGQFLLIVNHRSVIDPLVVEITLKDSDVFGSWISKKELTRIPVLNTFLKYAGTIPLDRKSKSVNDSFKGIKNCVKNGDSIFIFPEGTRNKERTQLSTFKKGTQMIALKNRLPILPLYIRTNADEALKSALRGDIQTIEVEIGEVVDYKNRVNIEEIYRRDFKIYDF